MLKKLKKNKQAAGVQKHFHDACKPLLLPTPSLCRIGIRRSRSPFSNDFHCYKGSDWFTLSYKCLEYIQQFIEDNPKFLKYYQKTIHASESFVHTILMNNHSLKICNDNIRYIQWHSPDSKSPITLRTHDFDRIVSSNKLFARKFDINVDTQILDMLDQHIDSTS